jgi:hypothetical protein
MSARKENHRRTTTDASADRSPTAGRVYRTGPYSRALERGAVGSLNGNSREAKFIKAYAAMLTEHCGGAPSPVQAQLIIRAARLACHLEIWDERTIPNGGAFTATGHNHYIAWSNALARTLARLGLEPAAAPQPTLQEVLANIAARHRAEEQDDVEDDLDDDEDAAA